MLCVVFCVMQQCNHLGDSNLIVLSPISEMLLNPGSRLPKNGRTSQSSEECDANSAYPARGPQRDFKTFGTSFELVGTVHHE